MADPARCADCGAVAQLFLFYGPWARDGRPQRGDLLCRACIERLSPPSREDYAERIAGSLAQGVKRWQEAIIAWNRDQLAREVSYQARRLEAGDTTQSPATTGKRRGPTSQPLTTEQRNLLRQAKRYRSLHQAAPNLGIPYTTLRGWALRYEREERLGVGP